VIADTKQRSEIFVRSVGSAQAEVDKSNDFLARDVAAFISFVNGRPEILPSLRKIFEPHSDFVDACVARQPNGNSGNGGALREEKTALHRILKFAYIAGKRVSHGPIKGSRPEHLLRSLGGIQTLQKVIRENGNVLAPASKRWNR